jgi:hypothetical protein
MLFMIFSRCPFGHSHEKELLDEELELEDELDELLELLELGSSHSQHGLPAELRFCMT